MNIGEILKTPEALDQLIQRIADEVVKRLNSRSKKALVLFTGGAIGFQEATKAVKKLVDDGWSCDIVASKACEGIYGKDKMKELTGVENIYVDGESFDGKTLLAETDLVVIAEMTINTCSKIACGIADNAVSDIVKNSILFGKRIVAAVDGACPDNKLRAQLGMNKEPKAYHDMLHDHLVTLASYGIWLCNAEDLYETIIDDSKKPSAKRVDPAPTRKAGDPKTAKIKKHVVSRSDILENQSVDLLTIPSDALLTHSASDLADELGIEISRR